MEAANDFFNNIIDNSKDFNTVKLGKVVKFDPVKMKADIQPLPSGDSSLLINVPVMTFKTGSFFIRLPLEVGDIVLVLFADNDLDNILLGGDNIATGRKHDLSDSICIGGITLFTERLSKDHGDDLIITNKDLTSKIVLSKNDGIEIKSDKRVTISGPTQSSTWD